MSRAAVVILLLSTLLPSPVWAETGVTEGQSGCAVTTDVTNINSPAAGISGTLTLLTDATCSWTAVSSQPWVTLSPASGTGPTTVTYQIAQWTATFDRTAEIAFNAWYVVVKQQGVTTMPPGQLPAAPRALAGSVRDRVVTLSWQAPTTGGAVSGYVIEIGTSPGATNIGMVATDLSTTWTYAELPDGLYDFRVRGRNAAGTGPASNEIELRVATTGPGGPPAPPIALAGSIADGVLALGWTNGSGGGPLTGHIIEAGTAAGAANIGTALVGPETTFRYVGVPAGRYFFRVRATNASGASAVSNELELTYGVPGAPLNLAARVAGAMLILSWSPPPGTAPSLYQIEGGSAPGSTNVGSFVLPGTEVAVPMAAIPPGVMFHVRVRAIAGGVAGSSSNEIIVVR
jgi:hypothetical protein